MPKTELKVLFKKMQKDDKKEVLEFHVQGDELPHSDRLVEMAGNIVLMEIEGCQAGELMAEFNSLQRDSKKTSLKFSIKGDNQDKAIKLYPFAGTSITLLLEESQMSIDEFYEGEDEGIEYNVNQDGTVEVNENQMSIDEVAASEDEPAHDEDDLLN